VRAQPRLRAAEVEELVCEAAARCLGKRVSGTAFLNLGEVAEELGRMGVRHPESYLHAARRRLEAMQVVKDAAGRAWRKVGTLVRERRGGNRVRRSYVFVFVRAPVA